MLKRNILGLLKTMRPKQWTKNTFIFAALLFDHKLFAPGPLLRTIAAFILFSMLSSAVYLINDVADMESDRQHPKKRHRPLAAGVISAHTAIVTAIVLAVVAIAASFALLPALGATATAYFVTMVLYSFWLKHIVIIDVMTIAVGFLLRVFAGVVVVHVAQFSPWLYVCTTLLALFIGINKRRNELTLLAGDASNHRRILDDYNLAFIDEMSSMITASTLVAYAFYTFSAPNLPQNHLMMLTIFFVIYGLMRYLYLIHVKGVGGAPDELLLDDKPLLASVMLWAGTVVLILYVF